MEYPAGDVYGLENLNYDRLFDEVELTDLVNDDENFITKVQAFLASQGTPRAVQSNETLLSLTLYPIYNHRDYDRLWMLILEKINGSTLRGQNTRQIRPHKRRIDYTIFTIPFFDNIPFTLEGFEAIDEMRSEAVYSIKVTLRKFHAMPIPILHALSMARSRRANGISPLSRLPKALFEREILSDRGIAHPYTVNHITSNTAVFFDVLSLMEDNERSRIDQAIRNVLARASSAHRPHNSGREEEFNDNEVVFDASKCLYFRNLNPEYVQNLERIIPQKLTLSNVTVVDIIHTQAQTDYIIRLENHRQPQSDEHIENPIIFRVIIHRHTHWPANSATENQCIEVRGIGFHAPEDSEDDDNDLDSSHDALPFLFDKQESFSYFIERILHLQSIFSLE